MADAPLQELDVHHLVALAHSDLLAEHLEGFRGVAPAPYSAQGRHPRIVPSGHEALLDELQELALTHEGICQVEPCEFVLVARIDVQGLDEPVVERTVDVELQGADRMGDVLDGVALSMGEVVHRIDAPLVTRAVVGGVLDAVEEGISEHHVGGCHVYLGTQDLLSVGIFAFLHLAEEPEVLLDAAVPVRTFLTGSIDSTASFADLFLALVVYIGETFLYELLGPLIELVEIVGGVEFLVPLEAHPADVFLDGVHIFGVLLGGVGVIVAEVGLAAVFLSKAEVYAEALRVAEVEVAVGLRREPGHYAVHLAGLEIVFDYLFKEIKFLGLFHFNVVLTILQKYEKTSIPQGSEGLRSSCRPFQ